MEYRTCKKCGNKVLLDKYCSYKCLEENAKKEGKSTEEAMEEMQKDVTEVYEKVQNKGKGEGKDKQV